MSRLLSISSIFQSEFSGLRPRSRLDRNIDANRRQHTLPPVCIWGKSERGTGDAGRAGVNRYECSAQIAGVVRGKEGNGGRHVFRLRPTLYIQLGHKELLFLGVACSSGRYRGHSGGRAVSVYAYAVRGEIDCHPLGEQQHGALGRAVSGDSGAADEAVYGAGVDNDALDAVLDPIVGQNLRSEYGALDVGLIALVQVRNRHVFKGDAANDAGIVDQDVNLAERLNGHMQHIPDLLLIAHIADNAERVFAELALNGVYFLLTAAAVYNLGALRQQVLYDAESDTLIAARDNGDLAFKSFHSFWPF